MRPDVREAVRQQFARRCGYCGVHEDATGGRLTVDHFQPTSQGGTDDASNLVYACHPCNNFKRDYWERDPSLSLLHPVRDDLSLHLVESVTHRLVALTERGRIYIETLHLNREELIARRRLNHIESDREAVLTQLLRRFDSLEAEIRRLQERLDSPH